MSTIMSRCCDAPMLEGGFCSFCREHAEAIKPPSDEVAVIECAGFQMPLNACPPGLFFFDGELCMKTEYRDKNGSEAYVVASGEYFWGGTDDPVKREKLKVIPWRLREEAE